LIASGAESFLTESDAIKRVPTKLQHSDTGRIRLARDLPPDGSDVSIVAAHAGPGGGTSAYPGPGGAPEQSEKTIYLHTPSLKIAITLQPFHIAFYGADDRPLLSQNYTERTAVRMKLTTLPFGFSKVNGTRVAFHDSFTAEPDEHFFGFGEKFTDCEKRGQRITAWN
jgi:alpha-D-xyloside xylohydrolase